MPSSPARRRHSAPPAHSQQRHHQATSATCPPSPSNVTTRQRQHQATSAPGNVTTRQRHHQATSPPGNVIIRQRHRQATSASGNVSTRQRHHQATSSPGNVITRQRQPHTHQSPAPRSLDGMGMVYSRHKFLLFKPGGRQNIALHVLPAARTPTLLGYLASIFTVHSTSFYFFPKMHPIIISETCHSLIVRQNVSCDSDDVRFSLTRPSRLTGLEPSPICLSVQSINFRRAKSGGGYRGRRNQGPSSSPGGSPRLSKVP